MRIAIMGAGGIGGYYGARLAAAGNEVVFIARAMGTDLPVDMVEAKVKQHESFPADMYASMYHDLSRGKRLELESLSGLVARKGRELGVPTPVHEMAYACLRPFLDGNAG